MESSEKRLYRVAMLQMQLSRRELLRRAGATGSVMALGGALGSLLAACGGEDEADPTATPSGSRAAAASSTQAMADAPDFSGRQITFGSWGGALQDAEQKAWCDPFAELTGASVLQDGPISQTKIRTSVEIGSPAWDVVDIGVEFLSNASKEGIFEPIDYSVVDTTGFVLEGVHPYGVGIYVSSRNIGYSTNAFPGDDHPRSWADVFDLQKFEGKRTFAANEPQGSLEVALLADGVDPQSLYPLDLDRAFAKFDQIKSEIIWWDTYSQSQQLFVDEEVQLGLIFNGRAYDSIKSGAPLAIVWDEHIRNLGYAGILKGTKNLDVAMALVAYAALPEAQAMQATLIPYSPPNDNALPLLDEETLSWLPTSPGNREKGFWVGAEYWAEHLESVRERWDNWRTS